MKNITLKDYAAFQNASKALQGPVTVFVNQPGYFQAATLSSVPVCYLFSAPAQPQTWAADFPLAFQVDSIEG